MPLTAESMAVLNILQEKGIHPLYHFAPAEGRPYFNAVFATPAEDREDVAIVRELSIPVAGGSIAARLYAPSAGPLPTIVHFHGGGWVYMGLETHDGYCRHLANAANIAVVAVEYRKAPEFKAPTAAEDCYAALKWVLANAASIGVDPVRVGVMGDSAGGNLAAIVSLMARDAGAPRIGYQCLIYPAVDALANTGSMARNADGYLLTVAAMRYFYDHYVPAAADRADWRCSPLRAATLAGVAPAMVITAGFDPLRDEGADYARRLAADGVRVEYIEFGSLIHGFIGMPGVLPQARRAITTAAQAVREALGG